ncbi:hypothetical protein NDU88_004116, partial [Pleurodeles waltl]
NCACEFHGHHLPRSRSLLFTPTSFFATVTDENDARHVGLNTGKRPPPAQHLGPPEQTLQQQEARYIRHASTAASLRTLAAGVQEIVISRRAKEAENRR